MKKLTLIYGTRPEAAKLAPLHRALCLRGFAVQTICTGQHTDLLANRLLPNTLLLQWPEHDKIIDSIGPASHAIEAHIGDAPVVVQGDTASAMAGALAALWREVPVIHVEAGIRSHDFAQPYPEELIRSSIDRDCRYGFCNTQANRTNLETEGCPGSFWVTGSTGIDHLYGMVSPRQERNPWVLVTLHRRESLGKHLGYILQGVWTAAQAHPELSFFHPVHPNPIIAQKMRALGNSPQNYVIEQPLGASDFAVRLAQCQLVVTDSGGVQEEAAALGVPCVVAREITDRPESVDLGLAVVAGRSTAGISQAVDLAMTLDRTPSACYGDGKASQRIADLLEGV